MFTSLFPGTRLNIQSKSSKTSENIGKTKETKTTKKVKAQFFKNHRKPKQQEKRTDPCPLWPTWV